MVEPKEQRKVLKGLIQAITKSFHVFHAIQILKKQPSWEVSECNWIQSLKTLCIIILNSVCMMIKRKKRILNIKDWNNSSSINFISKIRCYHEKASKKTALSNTFENIDRLSSLMLFKNSRYHINSKEYRIIKSIDKTKDYNLLFCQIWNLKAKKKSIINGRETWTNL